MPLISRTRTVIHDMFTSSHSQDYAGPSDEDHWAAAQRHNQSIVGQKQPSESNYGSRRRSIPRRYRISGVRQSSFLLHYLDTFHAALESNRRRQRRSLKLSIHHETVALDTAASEFDIGTPLISLQEAQQRQREPGFDALRHLERQYARQIQSCAAIKEEEDKRDLFIDSVLAPDDRIDTFRSPTTPAARRLVLAPGPTQAEALDWSLLCDDEGSNEQDDDVYSIGVGLFDHSHRGSRVSVYSELFEQDAPNWPLPHQHQVTVSDSRPEASDQLASTNALLPRALPMQSEPSSTAVDGKDESLDEELREPLWEPPDPTDASSESFNLPESYDEEDHDRKLEEAIQGLKALRPSLPKVDDAVEQARRSGWITDPRIGVGFFSSLKRTQTMA